MKHQILFLFLLLPLLAHAQDDCPHYPRLMQAARNSWKQGDYSLALNQLAAAREHCPDKGSEIDEQLVTFTEEIAAKYQEAETAREEARRQAAEAEKARARADSEADAARRAALRAYANDLAYKSETALRDGDRTSAFRLAEFAHRYVDADNDNVTRALVNALYYNDKPARPPLPWCANLEGHQSSVWSVAFSPDGTQLATGSDDNTAKLWNLQTGKATLTLEGHQSSVWSVAFSPDGTQLATGSDDNTAKLWNLQTGKATLTLEGHQSSVWSVAFSPDGTQLATGSDDNTAKLWNLQTGKATLTLEGHQSSVWSVAFSPDGTQLATGSDDNTAKLWNLQTGKATLTLEGYGLYTSRTWK